MLETFEIGCPMMTTMLLSLQSYDSTRSTVHTNTIPSKETSDAVLFKDRYAPARSFNQHFRDPERFSTNPARTLQAPQRIVATQAKPGRIVGPVVPYERGSVVKDAYDPRMFIRSAVPSHPKYYYRQSCGQNQERSATGAEQDNSLQCKQAPQCGMAANSAVDTAAPGVVSNPFFMTRAGVPKVGRNDSTLDEKLLQVNARYGAGAITSATATTHRNVGEVEYGMTRMY